MKPSKGVRSEPKLAVRRVVLALHSVAVGGMETYCVDLAAEFVRRGIAVTAIVPADSALDLVAHRFETAGAAVVRLETTAGRGRAAQLRQFLPMMRVLRSLQPDVVHVNVPGGKGGLVLAAAARLATRGVVVITEHDVPPEHPRMLQRVAQLITDRVVHATLAVSRRNAAVRASRSHPRQTTFASILNGVPVPVLSDVAKRANRTRVRAQFNIPDEAVVIGSVVRLADGKGLRDLIGAFAIVASARPCQLLLVGSGPLLQELQALTREAGIEACVHFAGEQRDPGAYVDAMDVFALAVPEGSMSIALLEAMARGVAPVITFCGPEEAVIDGETGLAAPPSDPDGLAAVLSRLIDDAGLRRRIGDTAEAHVRRHFSIARVADDVLCVYGTAKHGYVHPEHRADGPFNARPGDRPVDDDASVTPANTRTAVAASAPRTGP
ncbi:MAG TPA: glycosyltransferase family 4 protein [Dehalococcoidia bacterium]